MSNQLSLPVNSIVLWNLRSLYNVGAITRTAVSFNVTTLFCVGSTPYPVQLNDARLPHVAKRASSHIAKTALGAEEEADFVYHKSLDPLIELANETSTPILALEQDSEALSLPSFQRPDRWMLIVGEETAGIQKSVLDIVDFVIEIPHHGPKSSLNVSHASAIALYELTKTI